jgi:catechol 2,3-dioxygenase-like lactoylglutathione lyase family enzyme
MGSSKRFAPILPVRDLDVALDHYRRLGFRVRAYEGGGYGFAALDDAELHLGMVPADETVNPASAYLFVTDADQLAQTWAAAGVEVRFPEDTDWGQHEGVVIDPDGNVIRFGSPIRRPHKG